MKLDSGKVWADASAMIAANRQLLAAVAGVFMVLPSFALSVFFPEPQPDPNMKPEALMKLLGEYYLQLAPWFIPVMVASTIGVLALFTLMTDAGRPTVSEALRKALGGLLPYIGCQLLTTFAFMIVGLAAGAIGGVTGSVGLTVVLILAVAVAAMWVSMRLVLAGPIIAIEGQKNPIAALQRSWALTQGNAGRILLFMFLLVIVFFVVLLVTMGLVGLILALTLGSEAARLVSGFVSAVLGSGLSVFMTAGLAAIHHQLSGGGTSLGETFA